MTTNTITLNRFYELEIHWPEQEGSTEPVAEFEGILYLPWRKCWIAPPTAHNLAIAAKWHTSAGFEIQFNQAIDPEEIMQNFREFRTAASQAESPIEVLSIPGLRGRLHPSQAAAAWYIARTQRCVFGDHMRIGQSIPILAAVELAQALPAIILCKQSSVFQWEAEIRTWLPHRTIGHAGVRDTPADFILASYEFLSKPPANSFTFPNFKGVVFDKSPLIRGDLWTRKFSLYRIARGKEFRVAVTDVGAPKQPGDIASLLNILEWTPVTPQSTLASLLPSWSATPPPLRNQLRILGLVRRAWPKSGGAFPNMVRRSASLSVKSDVGFWWFNEDAPESRWEALRQKDQGAFQERWPTYRAWLRLHLYGARDQKVFAYHEETIAILKSMTIPRSPVGSDYRRHTYKISILPEGTEIYSLREPLSTLNLPGIQDAVFVEFSPDLRDHLELENHIASNAFPRPATIWYLLGEGTPDQIQYQNLLQMEIENERQIKQPNK